MIIYLWIQLYVFCIQLSSDFRYISLLAVSITSLCFCKSIDIPQLTANNIPYQIYFLFKDKDILTDIDKGQPVTKDGKIMQINDERLLISVWIYCGELNDKDKVLFNTAQPVTAVQSLP